MIANCQSPIADCRSVRSDQSDGSVAAQKAKIEAGLDARYLEVKDNAEAWELFQKFKAVATKATT